MGTFVEGFVLVALSFVMPRPGKLPAKNENDSEDKRTPNRLSADNIV